MQNYTFSSTFPEGVTKGGMPLSSVMNPEVLTTLLVGGRNSMEKEYYVPGGLFTVSSEKDSRECTLANPSEVPVISELFDELLELVGVKETEMPKQKPRITKKKRNYKK